MRAPKSVAKIQARAEREIRREMKLALLAFGAIRPAAAAIEMPRQSFHDKARELGLLPKSRRARRAA